MKINSSKKVGLLAVTSLLVLLAMSHAQAAPGDLDLSFGNGGIVLLPYAGNDFLDAYAIAIQSNGKIVTAGYGYDGTNVGFGIARYNSDGSPDPTFGLGGRVITDFGGGGYSMATAVAVQSDGKIIAAGSINDTNEDTYNFLLARYNTDGSLDSTFGSGGRVVTPFNHLSLNDIALRSDGKIVAVGNGCCGGTFSDFLLVRYNANGSLDSSFGSGGVVASGVGSNSGAFAVAIQSNDRIVAAGASGTAFGLARYNNDGSLDPTFGKGGRVITPVNVSSVAYDVAIQSDGRIVAAGRASHGAIQSFALTRYNTNGSLDATFGTGGIVQTGFSNDRAYAYAEAIQSDGKIVAAGYGSDSGNSGFALARYNTNGSLDSTFGSGGKVVTHISEDDHANAVAIQPDGKISVAGILFPTNGGLRSALARYQAQRQTVVANAEELYSAVNNSQNAGAQIIIAPGVYMLSVNDPNGAARPNSGRLELQENMSLVGVVGDRNAVVIDAMNLPASSYNNAPPIPLTAAIRMGRGTNTIEWLTVRNAVNGAANIETDLLSTGTVNIRIAHIVSSGGQRGIDVRNFGAAMAGRVIQAEIVDNDLFGHIFGLGEGLRFVNNLGATAGIITATITDNRSHNNFIGLLIENNRSNQGNISVSSTNDRFYENGNGALVGGGLSAVSTPANGNTVSFTAVGSSFENNNGVNPFDLGGLIIIGGENTSFPNGTSNNTVNVELRGCRLANNQVSDLTMIGARSKPVTVGTPGMNNHVNVSLFGVNRKFVVEVFADSIPDFPGGNNTVTITRWPKY